MNSIAQDIKFKQSVVKYSYKHRVTAAALVYKLHRKTIYRWRDMLSKRRGKTIEDEIRA